MKERHRHPQFSTKGLVAYYKLWAGLTSTGSVFDYSQSGFTGATAGTDIAPAYPGFVFNGTDDEIFMTQGPGSVLTIVMWIKVDDATAEDLIGINLITYIEIDTGDVGSTGFGGGSTVIYVDAVEATAISEADWHMITLTNTVGVNADLGELRIGATDSEINFLNGKMGEVMLYDRALTPAEIKSVYELTKWRYPNN
jgi:hypothetical protein